MIVVNYYFKETEIIIIINAILEKNIHIFKFYCLTYDTAFLSLTHSLSFYTFLPPAIWHPIM